MILGRLRARDVVASLVLSAMYVGSVRFGSDFALSFISADDRGLGAIIVVSVIFASASLVHACAVLLKLNSIALGFMSGLCGYFYYYVILTEYDPFVTFFSVVRDGISLIAMFSLVLIPIALGFLINILRGK